MRRAAKRDPCRSSPPPRGPSQGRGGGTGGGTNLLDRTTQASSVGTGLLWGDRRKGTWGVPELVWGWGGGFGGAPASSKGCAHPSEGGVKARQPSAPRALVFLGKNPGRAGDGEPAPHWTPLPRDAQDLGEPHCSQGHILHPFQPTAKKRGRGEGAHLAEAVWAGPGGQAGPPFHPPAPPAVPTGTPITQLLPNRT